MLSEPLTRDWRSVGRSMVILYRYTSTVELRLSRTPDNVWAGVTAAARPAARAGYVRRPTRLRSSHSETTCALFFRGVPGPVLSRVLTRTVQRQAVERLVRWRGGSAKATDPVTARAALGVTGGDDVSPQEKWWTGRELSSRHRDLQSRRPRPCALALRQRGPPGTTRAVEGAGRSRGVRSGIGYGRSGEDGWAGRDCTVAETVATTWLLAPPLGLLTAAATPMMATNKSLKFREVTPRIGPDSGDLARYS